MQKFRLGLVLTGLLSLAGCGGGGNSASTSSPSPGSSGSGKVTLQSIQVSPTTASIAQGTTQAFTATGAYSDGTTKDLTTTVQWSCLLSNLATVSSSSPTQGLALAALTNNGSPATALITASLGSVSNSAELAIKAASVTVSSLAVTPATPTIGFGNHQQFSATATFSDMSTQDVTNLASWSSFPPFITSNSGLAIGELTAGESVGTSSITAIFGQSANATLTVDLSNLVSVSVSPPSPIIANYTQLTFSATGVFNDGSTRDVTSLVTNWASSDATVAVNFGTTPGNFKAKGAGSAIITASIGTFTPSAALTVSDATLQSISLAPANATVPTATKLNYGATGTFGDGSTQDLTSQVTWSVQDISGGASISGKGVLTGSSAGSIAVSAITNSTLGSVSGSAAATVSAATLQSIAVTPATAFVLPGGALAYSAIGTFSDGSTKDVTAQATWTSSSKNVATVSSAVITGQGVGQSIITATLSGIKRTGNLMVVFPQQVSLAVTPATVQVPTGSSTQLRATGTFSDGTTQDFTTLVNWSSSNPTAATIGYQTGLVSGLASGVSTVTATLGSVTSTAQVTVR
jgi:trimeric autotransporter adhesin